MRSESPHALILRAASFAAQMHRQQRRKGADDVPYINHPLWIASTLATHGVDDPVTLAAALLHDTIEDTDATHDQLVEQFGREVADVVAEVTDDKSLEKAERKRLQVEHAPHLSQRAKLVKLVDKIANVRDVATSPPSWWPMERRVAYLEWRGRSSTACAACIPRWRAVFDEALAAELA